MGPVTSVILKEFRQIRRDRRMLSIILLAPVIQVFVLGYAATLDVEEMPTVVCDQDRSVRSRMLLSAFEGSGYFPVVAAAEGMDGIDDRLRLGHARLGIVIPKGFGKAIASREPSPLLLILDGTDAMSATIGLNHATQILTRFGHGLLAERAGGLAGPSVPEIRVESRVFYNERLRSADFMVPAVLALVLNILTITLTAMNIVREKEDGTIEQLIVTPVRASHLIIGKLAPFAVIGLFSVCLVTLIGTLWFEVPVRGSLWMLLLSTPVFLFSTLGLGLLVSTVSSTQYQAMMTAYFFVLIPSILLSGFIFPIENMPLGFQVASRVVPMRYYLEIVRGVFLKGIGFETLWPQLATMAGVGLTILAVAAAMFHKRLD